MMEKMMNIGRPPSVGKFRPEQIAQQSTWTVVAPKDRQNVAMHLIRIVPSNGSTLTYVNPVDPGDQGFVTSAQSWDKVTGSR